MIGLFFELIEWMIKLAVLFAVLLLKLLAALYRAIEQGVHGYRVGRNPNAQREHSQGIAVLIFVGILGVLALIGSVTGGSSTASNSTSPSSVAGAPPSSDEQGHTRAVVITAPTSGARYRGAMITSLRQRRAVVHVRGRAAPGERVYVSGNADVTSAPRDDATVTVASNGHWGAKVNAYGCGRSSSSSEIDAGYKSADGDGDKVTVRFRCKARSGPSAQSTSTPPPHVRRAHVHKRSAVPTPTPAPATPAGTTCADTTMHDFPVPPGDPRDRDGDGIACES